MTDPRNARLYYKAYGRPIVALSMTLGILVLAFDARKAINLVEHDMRTMDIEIHNLESRLRKHSMAIKRCQFPPDGPHS